MTLRQGVSQQAFARFEKEHKVNVNTMDNPSERLESEWLLLGVMYLSTPLREDVGREWDAVIVCQ